MLRSACILMLLWLSTLAGCAMCASCDDYNYGAYGGRWQRDDPVNGRVGSLFAPAGAMVIGETMLFDEDSARESADGTEMEEIPYNGSDRGLLRTREVPPQAASPIEDDAEDADDLTGISLPLLPQNAPRPGQRSILSQ